MKHTELDAGADLDDTEWLVGHRCELIGGTDLGRRLERGRSGRHVESVSFSSLTSPSLPISLCSSALAPTGGAYVAHAGVRGMQRRHATRAASVRTPYTYHYRYI